LVVVVSSLALRVVADRRQDPIAVLPVAATVFRGADPVVLLHDESPTVGGLHVAWRLWATLRRTREG